jgi:hypothetical protein
VNRKIAITELANFDVTRSEAISALNEARDNGEAIRQFYSVTFNRTDGYYFYIQ